MNSKKVTMQDIAREAGVSQTTVSMILNHRYGSFPQETIDAVLETARRMDYGFRTRRTDVSGNMVLVIVTALTNPFYANMIQSIDQLATEQGVRIVTGCTYHNAELEQRLVQSAVDGNYLGIIYLFPPDNIEAYEAARGRIAVVALCNRVRHIKGDCIQIDNFEAGAAAAKHLLDLGHRRIAVFSTSIQGETTSNATRLAGIMSEIEKVMPAEDLLLLRDNSDWETNLADRDLQFDIGYRHAQNEKILKNGITGIICANDLIAYGAMEYLTSVGYNVPKEFSIIGSDNLRYSRMPQIALTTVNLHVEVVAGAAFNTLMNRTSLSRIGRDAARSARLQVRCEVDLIVRGTTCRVEGAPALRGETKA